MTDDTVIRQNLTKNAVSWLESFQEREFRALGLAPPDSIMLKNVDWAAEIDKLSANQSDKFARQLKESLAFSSGQPHSRYDDLLSRAALYEPGRDLFRHVDPKLGLEFPIFGYSPRTSPNARVIFHKKSSKYIVVFNKGQFSYLTLAAGALAAACPFVTKLGTVPTKHLISLDNSLNVDRLYAAFPWFLKGLLESILRDSAEAMAIVQDICRDYIRPYSPTEIEEDIASSIYQGVNRFVVAHEFGHMIFDASHVIVGHYWGDAADDNDKPRIKELLKNIGEEVRADDIAIGILVRDCAAIKLSSDSNEGDARGDVTYLGVMMFFYLSLVLDHCVSVIKTGHIRDKVGNKAFSDTHPSLNARIEEAQISLTNHFKSPDVCCVIDPNEALSRGILFTRIFGDIIQHFWILLEPLLVRWHENGASTYLSDEYLVDSGTLTDRLTMKVPK